MAFNGLKISIPLIISETSVFLLFINRVVQNLTEAAEIVDVNKGMDEAFKILNIGRFCIDVIK